GLVFFKIFMFMGMVMFAPFGLIHAFLHGLFVGFYIALKKQLFVFVLICLIFMYSGVVVTHNHNHGPKGLGGCLGPGPVGEQGRGEGAVTRADSTRLPHMP
ncbi:hypothetical protein, partial [Enterobacter intestinihominis]